MQDNYTPQELNEQKNASKTIFWSVLHLTCIRTPICLRDSPEQGKRNWPISVHERMAEISSLFQAMITAGIILVSLSCKHSTVMMLSSIHNSSRGR